VINGRTKGHSFEREVACLLRKLYPTARRGLQYQDGNVCADVVNTPFHVECKRGRRVQIQKAMQQAERDMKKGDVPVVISKQDRDSILVTMRYEDWIELVRDHPIVCNVDSSLKSVDLE